MLPVTFSVPSEYGYVIIAAASTTILNFIHGVRVTKFRKAANVPYPDAYASRELADKEQKAYIFNCAQRAHSNYLENLPSVLVTLLIAGLKYPVTSAALGAFWIAMRYVYMVGYTKPSWGKNGAGRLKGGLFWLAQFGLIGLSIATGVQLVKA